MLAEDRKEKLEAIQVQRERLERLKAQDADVSGGEWQKSRRVDSMQRYLEKLKILADINDPMVKKRFEDGMGTYLSSAALSLDVYHQNHKLYSVQDHN